MSRQSFDSLFDSAVNMFCSDVTAYMKVVCLLIEMMFLFSFDFAGHEIDTAAQKRLSSTNCRVYVLFFVFDSEIGADT